MNVDRAIVFFFISFSLTIGQGYAVDSVLEAAASTSSGADSSAGSLGENTGSLTVADPQGTSTRLYALYKQRDAIAKGLDDLGYEICMQSRMTRVDRLISILRARKKGVKGPIKFDVTYDCLPGRKCERPNPYKLYGAKIYLPLSNSNDNPYRKEMKKTQILDRFLTNHGRWEDRPKRSQKRIDPNSGQHFYKSFFQRNSCLVGAALMRGCKLLSDRPIKDAKLKRLKAIVDKNEDFKNRFDGELACKIADSKKLYIEKLREVQELIVKEEREYRKEIRERREVASDGDSSGDQESESSSDEEELLNCSAIGAACNGEGDD